jgi:acetyltransferase-like isoleucine patch superfamily enzyme
MLKELIIKVFKKTFLLLKGRDLEVSDSLSFKDCILYFYHKGLMTAIRGIIVRPFIKSDGLIFIGKSVRIKFKHKLMLGKNCYIGDFSLIDCMSIGGISLGNNVTLREHAWVQLSSNLFNPGESITIGDNTYIGPYCKLGAAAPIKIGSFCQIGANVSFVAENHQFNPGSEICKQSITRKGIVVKNDCWIGNNVTILDGVTIGNGCVIGAGAVVTKSIPDQAIAVGVPAIVIKYR